MLWLWAGSKECGVGVCLLIQYVKIIFSVGDKQLCCIRPYWCRQGKTGQQTLRREEKLQIGLLPCIIWQLSDVKQSQEKTRLLSRCLTHYRYCISEIIDKRQKCLWHLLSEVIIQFQLYCDTETYNFISPPFYLIADITAASECVWKTCFPTWKGYAFLCPCVSSSASKAAYVLCLLATFYINKKDVSHPLNRPWGVMTLDLLTGIISSLNNQPATLLGDSDDAF